MFETIWMCTHEWSLIWSRTTAFTFDDVPPGLDLRIGVDVLEHAPELPVPARRHAELHRRDRLGGRQPRLGDDVRRRDLDDVVRLGIGRHRRELRSSRPCRGYATSAAQSPYRLRVRPGPGDQLVVRARSTIRPWSSTTIRSARRIVESRWAMMNAVRPVRSRRSPRSMRPLGADVDRRRRLVEDQDPRVGEERAGERDELALAERELEAALADLACRSRPGARRRTRPRRRPPRPPRSRRARRSGRPKAMLSAIEPAKRKPSCGTIPSCLRSDACVTSRRSVPSIVIRPSRGS